MTAPARGQPLRQQAQQKLQGRGKQLYEQWMEHGATQFWEQMSASAAQQGVDDVFQYVENLPREVVMDTKIKAAGPPPAGAVIPKAVWDRISETMLQMDWPGEEIDRYYAPQVKLAETGEIPVPPTFTGMEAETADPLKEQARKALEIQRMGGLPGETFGALPEQTAPIRQVYSGVGGGVARPVGSLPPGVTGIADVIGADVSPVPLVPGPTGRTGG